jgi:hypothetical protein
MTQETMQEIVKTIIIVGGYVFVMIIYAKMI